MNKLARSRGDIVQHVFESDIFYHARNLVPHVLVGHRPDADEVPVALLFGLPSLVVDADVFETHPPQEHIFTRLKQKDRHGAVYNIDVSHGDACRCGVQFDFGPAIVGQ